MRQAIRTNKPPLYLYSYKCNLSHIESLQGSPHCCNLVTFDRIHDTHKAFLSTVASDIHEPQSYKEASPHPLWIEAMNK